MKIRYDFVTNSSSTSFVCWGVQATGIKPSDDTCLHIYEQHCAKNPCQPCNTYEEKIQCIRKCRRDIKYVIFNQGNLSYGGPDEEYNMGVGITPDTILYKYPDKMIGEIREIVAQEFNHYLGIDFTAESIYCYEEGWYDG